MANMDQMIEAAQKAAEDLKDIDEAHIQALGQWWDTWYRQAGHKRLGRILSRTYKEGKEILEIPGVAER